jgi:RNA-binding protein YlmH
MEGWNRVDTFRSVEASLRVDALASAGFRMSRSKLADMISGGDVRVNWKEVTKNGLCLKTGDVVSVSGKGRIEVWQHLLPIYLLSFYSSVNSITK